MSIISNKLIGGKIHDMQKSETDTGRLTKADLGHLEWALLEAIAEQHEFLHAEELLYLFGAMPAFFAVGFSREEIVTFISHPPKKKRDRALILWGIALTRTIDMALEARTTGDRVTLMADARELAMKVIPGGEAMLLIREIRQRLERSSITETFRKYATPILEDIKRIVAENRNASVKKEGQSESGGE